MARSIQVIYNSMVAQVQADPVLSVVLTSTSATAIWRLIFWVVAFCAFVLETFFDTHTADVNTALRVRKSPTRQWYQTLVLGYQHGFPRIADTDEFDNTGYTDAQVEASKVVKYCAVIKQVLATGRVKLLIKVAGSNGTDLVQTPVAVVNGLFAYLDKTTPAGDNWEIVARPYDKIKMQWTIQYDPLILSATGDRLDGTAQEPARAAIIEFLKTGMPFSGIYEPIKHQDAVQKVDGVKLPIINAVLTQYGLYGFQAVAAQYNPDSGWIRFDQVADLVISYVPYKDE